MAVMFLFLINLIVTLATVIDLGNALITNENISYDYVTNFTFFFDYLQTFFLLRKNTDLIQFKSNKKKSNKMAKLFYLCVRINLVGVLYYVLNTWQTYFRKLYVVQ